MQPMIKTSNLGPVTISEQVVKHFSKLCDGDVDKALAHVTEIIKASDIERLEVPAAIASLMLFNGDCPDALEFWVHRSSSIMFLVKPKENYRLVEMAMNQSMAGFQFDNA